MTRFHGKRVLVTGAGRGLGLEVARAFAQEGADVFISDIDATSAAEAASQVKASAGLAHDVTEEADWDRVMSLVIERAGGVDILVNNAGVARLPDGNELETLSPATWRKVTEINCLGTALGCKHGLLQMKQRGGAIINLSSIASGIPTPHMVAYGFSKAGVLHLTSSTAIAGARHGIRCNAVLPGMVRTEMLKTIQRDAGDPDGIGFKPVIPMGEYQQESDIAAAVLFLASDEARFITGAQLPVDGGITLNHVLSGHQPAGAAH